MSESKPVYIGRTSAKMLDAAKPEAVGVLVKAILAWALRDELPDALPPDLAPFWAVIEDESRTMHELRGERAEAGRRSGEARRKKREQKANKNEQARTNANKREQTETEKETENSRAIARDARETVPESLAEEEAAWGAFWNAYPRRTNREQARRAWHDLFGTLPPKPETLAAILAAVQRGRASDQWREDGGRYIPSAEKWLRNRSWEVHDDALPPPAPRVRRANETNLTAIHSGNPQYANLPV